MTSILQFSATQDINPGTTSLEAWWDLDEGSGNRADSHGSNTLSDNNTVTNSTGVVSNAAQFQDSNSEFLHINDNASLSTGDIDYSLFAWVKLDSTPGNFMMIMSRFESNTNREYNLIWNNNSSRFGWVIFDSGGTARGTAIADNFGAPSTGIFYFVYVYHDSVNNEVGISINNGPVNIAATTGAPSDLSVIFRMGARRTTEELFWDGAIDEAGFYKKVLSSAEISWLYNGGNGRAYSEL